MPEGVEIDHKSPLAGVMAGYAEQVLICTGRDDWASRIEEENSGDNLAADLKELLGRGGIYSDPFNVVSVLNASFPCTPLPRTEVLNASAYLLPSFKYVPYLPRVSFDSVRMLVQGFLLPTKLHSAHAGLSPVHRDRLTRVPLAAQALPGVCHVRDVLVLICGHGGRDGRCGIMGPVLRDEFIDKLARAGFDVRRGPISPPQGEKEENASANLQVPEQRATKPDSGQTAMDLAAHESKTGARVGLVSHIGGHKFAGNVIIYLPPGLLRDGLAHPLAGHGIWYGRVEPRHVEGLVDETLLKGRIVLDMMRGGIDAQRQILRP
ncbi:hypothetical protein CDD82_1348 [Ophiocordyceps australis]|uniref:Altered inheritance of mitochondria protein 32 n=1 Tax=Ophiocordyceps australis TaxID=1399860 RepID=A0A2C5ZVC6_9HYPO|nr:hypothetical protein CDD82_1348 [Ophiocordyceps australis]